MSVEALTRSISTGPGRSDLIEVELVGEQLAVRLLNLGATLADVRPSGTVSGPSLTLSLPDPLDYLANPRYFGVTAGPVANRIAGAAFQLDGEHHVLVANEGPNQLHGGPTGFSHQPWAMRSTTDADGATREVRFHRHRPDGEGGFPGNLDVVVGYRVEGRRLRYTWSATSDAPTPVSLTNHAYWNLAGAGTIVDHELVVPAGRLVEVDGASIPTGVLTPVADTPFDLRRRQRLGAVIERSGNGGIDRCYVYDNADGGQATVLSHPPSGRRLEITTTLPGIQVYTGQFLDGSAASGHHQRHGGVCLETQHLPDAVNRAAFPSCIVGPGQPISHTTDYLFTV